MSEPDQVVFWSLPEALTWGQSRDPPDVFYDFLWTLHALCRSGRVRSVGRRSEWAPGGNREEVGWRQSVAPRPRDLAEPIPAREWEDLHFDGDGQNLRTEGLFSFSRHRQAWTQVQFSRGELIQEWPIAGAAAFLEAEAARHWADRDQKAKQRRKREGWRRKWIDRFFMRQQQARRWISFVEIADMCARAASPGSIAAEEEARALAYRRLVESMWRGEFARNGLSHVLLLLPDLVVSVPPHRLTHDYFRAMVDACGVTDFTSNSELVKEHLWFCWLPNELCRQWCESHGFSWPAAFNPGGVQPPRTNAQSFTGEPKKNPRKEIPEVPVQAAAVPPKGRRGRKRGSGSFDDDQVLQEMLQLLASDEAVSVNEAAHRIVTSGRAKKTGTDASAIRRLGRKFAVRFGTEPPPGKTWTDVVPELQSN